MKQVKRLPAFFAFYDGAKIEEKLEEMSRNGWVLQKIGAYFWTYQRAEPKKRHVAVVYVADASEYNPRPTAGQDLLEELSVENGWKLQYRWGQMHIFYSEQDDPVPMQTDPRSQVETIHRAMKKNGLRLSLLNLAFSIYMLVFGLWQLRRDPVDWMTSGLWLWMFPESILIFLKSVVELVGWRVWYHKALAAAEQGEFPRTVFFRRIAWFFDISMIPVTVLLLLSLRGRWLIFGISALGVLAVILLTSLMTKALKQRGCSKRVNQTASVVLCLFLTFVILGVTTFLTLRFHLLDSREPMGTYEIYQQKWDIYDDELPLTLEDLDMAGTWDYSREQDRTRESILVDCRDYRQWPLSEDPEAPELEYTIVHVKAPALFGFLRDGTLDKRQDVIKNGEILLVDHFEPIDSQPWNADEAYQLHWSGYLMEVYFLCYGNRMVELRLPGPPSPEQMQIISQAFDP